MYHSFRLLRVILLFWMLFTACVPQAPAIIPTAIQPADTPALKPSPTFTFAPPTVASPDLPAKLDTFLNTINKQKAFTGSALIAYQGKVLVSKGYGLADRNQNISNTAQTRFRLGSLTKQFTAMAILILESQGKLNVKDSICNYLANCPSEWKAITIHHLLTHTSGIPDFTNLDNYQKLRATPSAPLETIARVKDLPLDFQPGATFKYSNSNYVVLGYIIEKVSNQSYESFLQQYIFSPLKLGNTGYDHNSNGLAVGYRDAYSSTKAHFIDMSIPYAAGALYSTVEDLYRWIQALSTEQIVPRAYLDQMFAPQVAIPDMSGGAYGYGWIVIKDSDQTIYLHGGGIEGFTAYIAQLTKDQMIIILLGNQENLDLGSISSNLVDMIHGNSR